MIGFVRIPRADLGSGKIVAQDTPEAFQMVCAVPPTIGSGAERVSGEVSSSLSPTDRIRLKVLTAVGGKATLSRRR